MKAKADITTKIYHDVFDISENHKNVNRYVKAVIINFGDERGDIVVSNDNYGTKRKYADFTNGKKAAGLHPLQIVFSGVEFAVLYHDRYVGPDDKIHVFGEASLHTKGKTISHSFVQGTDFLPQSVDVSYANVPVYYQNYEYASEHGEIEQFSASVKLNETCKTAIERAIAEHFDGYRLDSAACDEIVELYGFERSMCILAKTIQVHDSDGRVSRDNISWAAGFHLPDNHDMQYNVLNTSPGLVDLFARMIRSNYLRTQPLLEADIKAEAERILTCFRNTMEPNSPNGTHFSVKLSDDFLFRANTRQLSRLGRYFPFRTFTLSSLNGEKGRYAMIAADEDRSKPLRTLKPPTRKKTHETEL